MIYTVNSKSKHLNLKMIKFFLTRFQIPIKLIPINLKRLIAIVDYNKLAFKKLLRKNESLLFYNLVSLVSWYPVPEVIYIFDADLVWRILQLMIIKG